MSTAQSSQYFESKILTAPPHRLHLMLIEGAIRFGRQAETNLRSGDESAAAGPLMRLLDIVGEMLARMREKKSELNQRIGDFYWYLFRRASLAKIHGNVEVLAEVLDLLQYERETWQLVCAKLGDHRGLSPPAPSTNLAPTLAMKPNFSLEA